MSRQSIGLDGPLYQYLLDNSLREDAIATRLREITAPMPMARMQISPEQGQFMGLLVQLLSARRIIEVGTFTGYSALCMARALPPEGQLICCDISHEWTAIGKTFWQEAGIAERIDLRIAPAQETLDQLLAKGQAGSFDMTFVDADKTGYDGYFESCLQLLRPGGLMLFDNTLWDGAVADPGIHDPDTEALRRFNKKLHGDDRVNISLTPIGDGLTLAVKN